MSATLDVSLPRFEGPLDLLLDLVRKHEIDIADIPISDVTRQYLEYIRRAEQLDIDLGAEFTYIAALLIHIKSRSLLTRDPELATSEEDPRQELVRLLLDRDQVRAGAEFLSQKLELAQATWSKSAAPEFQEDAGSAPPKGVLNLLDVLRLAKQALETARAYELIFPTESVTVEEMEHWLDQRMDADFEEGTVDQFLAEQTTTDRKTALFLAVLEKAKSGRMQLEQIECFGPIKILLNPKWHNCAATSTNG